MFLNRIKEFWIESYKTDRKAFYYEMISAICVITGGFILTYTVLEPLPKLFIPFYWFGSLCGIIGAYYRKSSWIMVLMATFTIMHTVGLWRLFL